MNITVYLGSAAGTELLRQRVRELGTWIGERGHRLIYGGSREGLMGALADACIAAGAETIGVEPAYFIENQKQHPGIGELIVVDTMPERRTKLIELGEVFIAFPGGTGTLEEISEVMSQEMLGQNTHLCLFYNIAGYWEPMRGQLQVMEEAGLLRAQWRQRIRFVSSLEEIDALVAAAEADPEYGKIVGGLGVWPSKSPQK